MSVLSHLIQRTGVVPHGSICIEHAIHKGPLYCTLYCFIMQISAVFFNSNSTSGIGKEKAWHDVGMASSCNASLLSHFLVHVLVSGLYVGDVGKLKKGCRKFGKRKLGRICHWPPTQALWHMVKRCHCFSNCCVAPV